MDVTTAASASLKIGNLDFECFSKLQIPSNPVLFFLSYCLFTMSTCQKKKKKQKRKKRLAWGDYHFKQHGLS